MWGAANQQEGAMVVADFLLSPEAQLEKQRADVWGDGTVLALDRLPVVFDFSDEIERGPGATAHEGAHGVLNRLTRVDGRTGL